MTVTKSIQSTALLIEVSNGVNKKGEAQFNKKSFSHVIPTAAPEDVYTVAKAISNILAGETRRFYLKDTSLVTQISES